MSSFEFRLRKIDEAINYLLDEVKHNDLMIEKYKKTCTYLNYLGLVYFSFNSYRLSFHSAFASLVCVPVGITSSAVGFKICAINAGIKKKLVNHKEKEEA